MKSPVLRNFLVAVLGYTVMFPVAFVLFSLMWMALGADGSFDPGVWDVSIAWLGGSTVLGLIVAMSGGFVCSKLGTADPAQGSDRPRRPQQSVMILCCLVAAVGVWTARNGAPAATLRPDDISMFDAMTSARLPTWLLWLNPVFGVIGVLLGAKLAARKSA